MTTKPVIARYIRECEGFTGDARLYELSQPVPYGWDDEDKGKTRFVVVSGTFAMFSGPETFIFPADAKGNVVDWGEMPGSFQGAIDHEQAIRDAGWTLAE